MERLFKGIQKFQQLHYNKEKEFYTKIAKGQSPDVLFFTCSDSRVDPNLITQSKPGELFIVKNVGNIVPPCDTLRKKTCTAAAIEFALLVLKVTDIVVCGHSDCGAMKALYYDDADFCDMPNLKDWVDTASDVKEQVLRHDHSNSYNAKVEMTEKKYIIQQLENLKTYKLVENALKEEKLNLHGWYYEINSGAIHAFNKNTGLFEKINYNDKSLENPTFADRCEDVQ